jgi:hypothetical protein
MIPAWLVLVAIGLGIAAGMVIMALCIQGKRADELSARELRRVVDAEGRVR